MSDLIIGTSGYYYNGWTDVLYPQGTAQSDFLKIYAEEFGMTELNFSYYRMPEASMTRRMALQTGSGFLFSVKAHKTLTHQIVSETVSSEVALFIRGIEPIIDAGKLGAVLLQFPFSFHYSKDNRTFLDRLYREFKELPLAVEFRNRHWQRPSVYEGLRERGIAFVNVDEPQIPGLLKPGNLVTSSLGYVRMHGRNRENWWEGDNVTRYDYCYSDSELQEWVPRVRTMMVQAGMVLVVFNNHSKGQAVQNARRLKELINVANGQQDQ